MKHISVEAEIFKKKESETDENIADAAQEDLLQHGLAKTEIGYFSTKDGVVRNHLDPSSMLMVDMDEYEFSEKTNLNFVLPDDHNIHRTEDIEDSLYLTTGDKILIDTEEIGQKLDFKSDNNKIAIEIMDSFRVNEAGTSKNNIQFLSTEFDMPILSGDEDAELPDSKTVYLVERSDHNTVTQRTILTDEFLDDLIELGYIEKLVAV